MNTVPLFALKLTVQINYTLQVDYSLWIDLVLRLKHMHKKASIRRMILYYNGLYQRVSAGPVSI